MKIRNGFVTNSSSSSFVISKNDLTFEQVIQFVKMYQIKDKESYGEESSEDDIKLTVCNDSIKTEDWATMDVYNDKSKEIPYVDDDERKTFNDKFPEGWWYFDNDTTTRFDWSIIDEVCDYFGCNYIPGYCN